MMPSSNTISVLHLADLHLNPKSMPPLRRMLNALHVDLTKLKTNHKISPDLVIFSGDLVNKGDEAPSAFQILACEVIQPLLEMLNLTQDQLICCPGNHDVQRSLATQEIEQGLNSMLTSEAAFEEYYQNYDPQKLAAQAVSSKLGEYQKLVNAFANQNMTKTSMFFSTYRFNHKSIRIGVASFNTAWRSSQFGADRGRLIVGAACVSDAVDEISDCDFKIAVMHHPIEYLEEWDAVGVRRKLSKHFGLLCTGHMHDSDVAFFKQSYGAYVHSAAGCMNFKNHFNHYSVIRIDIGSGDVECFLRKWYEEREEFDEETAKSANGRVFLKGIFEQNQGACDRLLHHELRRELCLQDSRALVNPLEGVVDMTLTDLFVEPALSENPTFGRDGDAARFVSLDKLLRSGDNIVVHGRPDYGKTALLGYIRSQILADETAFEGRIPVSIPFRQLPKNNPGAMQKLIHSRLNQKLSIDQIDKALAEGLFVIMIDDFLDVRDEDVSKRVDVFGRFFESNKTNRFIFTLTEQVDSGARGEAMLAELNIPHQTLFLWPFNTGRIRQLLKKVNLKKPIEVDRMLEQIVFYFSELQIPITPLAVTLFIGVLFRDSSKNNIQNEAYLIENYLEEILEKGKASDIHHLLDFREKEAFLARIAFRMVELGHTTLSETQFQNEITNYFEWLDEPVPKVGVFDNFFDKGILVREEARAVRFKFHFWFHFFLAKAMEGDEAKKRKLLSLPNYLSFGTAFGYKAGLSRNDEELLSEIALRTEMLMEKEFGDVHVPIDDAKTDDVFQAYCTAIETEIWAKNTEEAVDQVADQSLQTSQQTISQSTSAIASQQDHGYIELISLFSDVLRNTRELDPDLKRKYLLANTSAYTRLMWVCLGELGILIATLDEDALRRFLFGKRHEGKNKVRVAALVDKSKNQVYRIVPTSILLYLTDRLGNPKLAQSVRKCADLATDPLQRAFLVGLLIKLDFTDGLKALEEYVKQGNPFVCDQLLLMFLRIHAIETKLDDTKINKLIKACGMIRDKYPAQKATVPPFVHDTFEQDLRKRIAFTRSTETDDNVKES